MPEVVNLPTIENPPPPFEEVVPPTEDPPAPQYTATVNFNSVNEPTIEWGDESHLIKLDGLFVQGEDENCAYRTRQKEK